MFSVLSLDITLMYGGDGVRWQSGKDAPYEAPQLTSCPVT